MAAKPRVEARSLSEINILAANPPQYPHHPTVRESLTLYISRVPGTRGAPHLPNCNTPPHADGILQISFSRHLGHKGRTLPSRTSPTHSTMFTSTFPPTSSLLRRPVDPHTVPSRRLDLAAKVRGAQSRENPFLRLPELKSSRPASLTLLLRRYPSRER